MKKLIFEPGDWRRAAAAAALGGLVTACAADLSEPAPVILKGAELGMQSSAPPPPRGEVRHLVVRPGQSLGGIAQAYHVPKHAIIAANHLAPPYELLIGQRLVIPGGSAPPAPQRVALAPPPAPVLAAAPPGARHAAPEIIPLDGPAPPAAAPAPATPTPAAAARPALEPGVAGHARGEPAAAPPPASAALPHGGHYPWPVRGRVLAGYGVAASGEHNDGINIAAPKGAPIAAVDGGVVAYAGNEIRGYGNLVLVKHPNGFISAYAHCEDLLVKRGDTVSAGQTIARVGDTGGVKQPQLHFELRRGKKAVDPREFLATTPSADAGRPANG